MRYDTKIKSKLFPKTFIFFDEKYFTKDFEKSKISKNDNFLVFFEKVYFSKILSFSTKIEKSDFFEIFDFSKSFEKCFHRKK